LTPKFRTPFRSRPEDLDQKFRNRIATQKRVDEPRGCEECCHRLAAGCFILFRSHG
jgi:hypothetical protein